MVKLILMPKFEHQMARRIAYSEVCKSIIPRKALVRVAICQDGREPITQSDLTAEISYFKMLYDRYLYWQDVQLEFYSFSFLESLVLENATSPVCVPSSTSSLLQLNPHVRFLLSSEKSVIGTGNNS